MRGLHAAFETGYPPTATQNVVERHAPPENSESYPGIGALGAATMDQRRPFHSSTKTPIQNPASMQNRFETHDNCCGDAVGCAPPSTIPGSTCGAWVRGLSMGTIRHVDPFQVSE